MNQYYAYPPQQYPQQQYMPPPPQQYMPQPQYMPQQYMPQQSSGGLMNWFMYSPTGRKVGMVLAAIVVLLLIYYFGCGIPIIGALCPILEGISNMFSWIGKLFGLIPSA